MIRAVAVLLALSSPALAWEFTPGQPCLLTHQTDTVSVKLTFDPTVPVYTYALTRAKGFDAAPVFALQFLGDMPISISTGSHVISADGTTLTVTDSGFGNVLNGLQFNTTSMARLGDLTIEIPLIGAADPVAAFRACKAAAATS